VEDKDQALKQPKARTTAREAYEPPKLVVFGPVGALTQGGMSGDLEMGMGMAGHKQMT